MATNQRIKDLSHPHESSDVDVPPKIRKITCLEHCPKHVLQDMLYKHWMRDIANAENAVSSSAISKFDHASSGFDRLNDRFHYKGLKAGDNSVLWRSLKPEDIASYLEVTYPYEIDGKTVSVLVKDDITNEDCHKDIRKRMRDMYHKDVSEGLPVEYQFEWMGKKIRIPVEKLTTINIAQYVEYRYGLRVSPSTVVQIVKAMGLKSKALITTHHDCPDHVLTHLLALHNKTTDMERSYNIPKSDGTTASERVHLGSLTNAHISRILSYRHGHDISEKAVGRIIQHIGAANPPQTPEYGMSREGSPTDNPLLHECHRAHTYQLRDTVCDCEGGREGMEKRETEFIKSGLASARCHYCSKASAPKWKSTKCDCDGRMDERQEKFDRFQQERTERSTEENRAERPPRASASSSKQQPRSKSRPKSRSPPIEVTVSAGGRRPAGKRSSGPAPAPLSTASDSGSGSSPVRIGRRTRRPSEAAPPPTASDSDGDSDNVHVRHWARYASTRSSSGSSPRDLTHRDREARQIAQGAKS